MTNTTARPAIKAKALDELAQTSAALPETTFGLEQFYSRGPGQRQQTADRLGLRVGHFPLEFQAEDGPFSKDRYRFDRTITKGGSTIGCRYVTSGRGPSLFIYNAIK
jgi:hypothetical protein